MTRPNTATPTIHFVGEFTNEKIAIGFPYCMSPVLEKPVFVTRTEANVDCQKCLYKMWKRR